jgi:hypothetical protein
MYTLGKFKSTDVFTMATLLSKIGLGKAADGFGRDNIMQIIAANKNKSADDVAAFTGMQLTLQIAEIVLGNLDQCETEVFKLLSSVSGAPVDELRNLDAEVFAELVIDVVQLQQFKDFFKVASRLLNTKK